MTTTSDSTTAPRNDVYTRVTNRIIEDLERGVQPWHQPWNAGQAGSITRPLRHNGQPYKGINILMLWAAAELQGYACPIWLTFRQVQHSGGSVRKGEHGSSVVYASKFKTTIKEREDEAEIEEEHFFLKEYTVFNVQQCDGLPEHLSAPAGPPKEKKDLIKEASVFFANTKAKIEYGGDQAYYQITADSIHLPPSFTFRDSESHAATLAHELTHWTRHPSRLNRELGRKRWGDEGYAMEELVAELGSAFLCADLKITPEVRDDHASYVHSWLKVLRYDKRAVFSAASLASKAVDYLHGLQPQPIF